MCSVFARDAASAANARVYTLRGSRPWGERSLGMIEVAIRQNDCMFEKASWRLRALQTWEVD